MFTLQRSFEGEVILVDVDLDAQPGAEDDEEYAEDEEPQPPPCHFRVTVSKGEQGLVFDCETNGEWLVINHLALESAEETDEEQPDYTGPVFDELDDTLQQAFLDYLEERGVNIDLADYLIRMMNDKLAVEYMGWLQRVRDFVARAE